jgi:restriction endonuclease S subunit
MMLYRPDPEKAASTFLLYAIMSPAVQKNLLRKIGGSTVGHARVDDIRNLEIPFPTARAEQDVIAAALNDSDALVESLEQRVAKKRDIKQGATQELLAGKKRLLGFSGEWQRHRVEEVITRFFCGPSPTCEERNVMGDSEWGVLKTTAATWEVDGIGPNIRFSQRTFGTSPNSKSGPAM